MNWYFDGSNLQNNKPNDEALLESSRSIKKLFDSFVESGFTRAESLQIVIGLIQASLNQGKKGNE